MDNSRNMFESKISPGAIDKLHHSEKLGANISSWSCDVEGHAKKCVERYYELANKTTQQLYKVATPCIYDHQFKEEAMGFVGELSTVCSQIVLKCQYLARIGRRDILWSVNKLARAVTKWTKASNKRSARLISKQVRYLVTQRDHPTRCTTMAKNEASATSIRLQQHWSGQSSDSRRLWQPAYHRWTGDGDTKKLWRQRPKKPIPNHSPVAKARRPESH